MYSFATELCTVFIIIIFSRHIKSNLELGGQSLVAVLMLSGCCLGIPTDRALETKALTPPILLAVVIDDAVQQSHLCLVHLRLASVGSRCGG